MTPTIGRIVIYKLGEQDVAQINARRTANAKTRDAYEFGNPVAIGQEFPAVICQVFSGAPMGTVNLKVLLDGYDEHWATSRTNVACDHVRAQQEHGFYPDGQSCYRWPTVTVEPDEEAVA